jgi:hypothetical protein
MKKNPSLKKHKNQPGAFRAIAEKSKQRAADGPTATETKKLSAATVPEVGVTSQAQLNEKIGSRTDHANAKKASRQVALTPNAQFMLRSLKSKNKTVRILNHDGDQHIAAGWSGQSQPNTNAF